MRIKAPSCPRYLLPGRHDRTVYVNGQATQLGAANRLSNEFLIDPLEPLKMTRGEPAKPTTDRLGCRHRSQSAQPLHQTIIAHEQHMLQTPPADDKQPEQQDDADQAVHVDRHGGDFG